MLTEDLRADAVSDPLQKVLAAESAARKRVEEARAKHESELRSARVEATRIKERNARRTEEAVIKAEKKCADRTRREIEELESEFGRQLSYDEASVEERLDAMAREYVDRLWPGGERRD